MDDALVVQLEIRNFAQAMAQIRQYSQAVKAIPNPIGGRGGGGGGRAANVSQVGQQAAGVARGARQAMDPAARALKNLVYSMRVNVGAGGKMSFSPLIGRLYSLLGEMGPIGYAIAAATGALGAFTAAAHQAAEVLGQFRQSQLARGGTTKQTLMAQAIGSNLGIDPQAVQAAAHAFAGEMASPEAMAIMPQFANPQGTGPFGVKNQMKPFLEALDQMRTATDATATEMMHATPSLEAFARVRDMTDEEVKALKRDVAQRAAFYNPEALRIQREFQKNSAELSRLFSDMATGAGVLAMNAFNNLFNAAKTFGFFLASIPHMLLQFITGMSPGEIWKRFNVDLDKMKNHTDAMKEHSDAMDSHTKALAGTYGGGDRARSALPGAYGGNFSSPGVMPALRQAVNLGALAI